MIEGGCICGAVRIQSTGEAQAKALCYCLDCRKTTGSTFSTNILVPAEGFTLTKGTPKEFAKTANSGKTITSFFCGDCGTTLWRETETYTGSKILKVGTFDHASALEDAKPLVELFTRNRPSWQTPIAGVEQKETL
ncbi:DUF636 domain protein [Sodiomyces alkalinus F11]|uniref:DUF636 domain protein n=1 Tax=Sodiomyces alkalinus (strain CBS 110278 / VKM F-3762 / F11) TaxID=1314773 RepID=A0A3N2PXM4_SODAK|nr:DUF636 domain protein [Sodiomyces alkalinus F11]ROT39232.1 DUF636 domain protein [Sodiomyces alkalinus F11]